MTVGSKKNKLNRNKLKYNIWIKCNPYSRNEFYITLKIFVYIYILFVNREIYIVKMKFFFMRNPSPFNYLSFLCYNISLIYFYLYYTFKRMQVYNFYLSHILPNVSF